MNIDYQLLDEAVQGLGITEGSLLEKLLRSSSRALINGKVYKLLKELDGLNTHKLVIANLVYDAIVLGTGGEGVGCSTFCDPVSGKYLRTLDWEFPRNLKDHLEEKPFEGDYDLVDLQVPGLFGSTTIHGEMMCVFLNQAPERVARTPAQTVRYLILHRNRLPTLVWVKTFASKLKDIGIVPDALAEMFEEFGCPLAPCILTGMHRHKEDCTVRTAFKLEFDGNTFALNEESEYPVFATNHFTMLRNPEAWGSDWECPRFEDIEARGARAFEDYPVFDEEIQSAFVGGWVK